MESIKGMSVHSVSREWLLVMHDLIFTCSLTQVVSPVKLSSETKLDFTQIYTCFILDTKHSFINIAYIL